MGINSTRLLSDLDTLKMYPAVFWLPLCCLISWSVCSKFLGGVLLISGCFEGLFAFHVLQFCYHLFTPQKS